MLNKFRKLGFAEATSLLILLGVAMPLKYIYGMPMAVRLMGTIHGALFTLYFFWSITLASDHKWGVKKWVFVIFAATIPFGPFIFDKKLFPDHAET